MSRARVRQTALTLPVSKLLPENPLPRFADAQDRPLLDGGLLQEEKEGFAKDTGLRVLPYRMQDRYAPSTETRTIPAIVLENDRLRATFLPRYGGRLYSLWDRQKERECLYRNSEIVLRNLALRDAWFSGGIEWNFGHFGHTYFTCQDMFFAACTDESGEPFLRMYEFERCKQVTFQVDFHLPEGSNTLTAHMRLENRLPTDAPIFLWTNIALPQEQDMRVYSGTAEVIAEHIDPTPGRSSFYHSQLPHLGVKGLNAADPSAIPYACEYFYQNEPAEEAAFEAACYGDGGFFAERSTGNFPYRKVFAWGTHAGGRRWQRLLAGQGAGDYLEIQAGNARTQVHSSAIAANSVLHITQQFAAGRLSGVPEGDYTNARGRVQAEVERLLPVNALKTAHQRCVALSAKEADDLLHTGTGWGALEARRDPDALPAHLRFPSSTLSEEQAPWLALLQGRAMETCDSFMVAWPWKALLERAKNKSAAAWNQLGIAYMESGQPAEAEEAWEQSLRLGATPLAYRNLACLAARRGELGEAVKRMEEALRGLPDAEALRPYALEYLCLLTEAGRYADAFAYYRSLPPALQAEERMRLSAMKSAYELDEDAFLRAAFDMDWTVVKESETLVHDIWLLHEARRKAKQLGVPCTDGFLEEWKKTARLPERLDFRMANPSIRSDPMLSVVAAFCLEGNPIYCERYGLGHINETYLVKTDRPHDYILQKINSHVFQDVPGLMRNIAAVTRHLARKDPEPRHVLTLIPTRSGDTFFVDDGGAYWRAYDFIADSVCLQQPETPDDFFQSAVAFGAFQNLLADFPAGTLHETIPRFHDTPNRYAALRRAVQADAKGRYKDSKPEVAFYLEREAEASAMTEMLRRGELPMRVTHNDTKLNNVMLDARTRKALCVIDLDTVMPGLAGNDFGDSIRFGASTGAEDERDLSKVTLSLPLYNTYVRGYLGECGERLTDLEVETLPLGAKLMTLECGVRFLTDYLAGDVYFHIHRPGQNLDRSRTQCKLVADMESKWEQMTEQVANKSGGH